MKMRLVRLAGSFERDASVTAKAASEIAMGLGVPLTEARALLDSAPTTLPRAMPEEEASALVAKLAEVELRAELMDAPDTQLRCAVHERFHPERSCPSCGARMCTVCVALAEGGNCQACVARTARRGRWARIRLGTLVALLLMVMGFAVGRRSSAEHRRQWRNPITVGVVILSHEGVATSTVSALEATIRDLEEVLHEEYARYSGDEMRPFRFHVAEVLVDGDPPYPRANASLVERAVDGWEVSRYFRTVNREAAEATRGVDIKIYIQAIEYDHSGTPFVEGVASEDGDYGLVRVVLTGDMVDQAAFAAAHELFHCLGASDKYDRIGHTRIPAGLVEPDRVPLFPQARAEVMVGERPLDEESGVLVETIEELGVGPRTAEEIGWSRR